MTDQPTRTREQWDQDVLEFAAAQEWADGETARLDDQIASLTERKRAIREVRERIEGRIKAEVKAQYDETGEMPHPRFEARTLTNLRYDRNAVLEIIGQHVTMQDSQVNSIVSIFTGAFGEMPDVGDDDDTPLYIVYGDEVAAEVPAGIIAQATRAAIERELDPYLDALRIKRELDANKFKASWNLGLLPDVPAVLETETIIALTQRDLSDITAAPDRNAADGLIAKLNEQLEAALDDRAAQRAAELLPAE